MMVGFRKFPVLLCVAAVACAWGAPRVVVETADFAAGVNTNGWSVSSSSWASPDYPAPAVSVSLTGTNLEDGASLTVARHGSRFEVGAVGGAKLASFSAAYTISKLLAPADVQITNIVDSGFTACWSPVADAVGYRLNFYTNVLEGASPGEVVFEENFTHVPSKGSANQLDPDTFNGLTDTRAGWSFSACYYGVEPASNMVQIGSSSNGGWLALPRPDRVNGGGYTLEFTARRFESAGAGMPVSIVSEGVVTNWLGSVALDVADSAYRLPLPAMSHNCTIYFHSTTNKKDGRVALGAVKILAGYDAGHKVEAFAGSAVVRGTSFATNSMPAIDYLLSVTTLAEAAEDDSDESPRIDLPLADPPLMPVLRAYPISSCVGGIYEEDFDALSAVVKNKTPWYNGVSPVPYWMCCRDNGTIVAEIGVGTTNTSVSGLFKYRADPEVLPGEYEYGEVLGWRGTSDRSFYTGIAFVNDTTAPRINFEMSFLSCQWNYRNEEPMTNAVEYLVTNELVGTSAKGNWIEIPSLAIAPPYTKTYNDGGAPAWWSAPQSASIPALELLPGEYLIVRFADLKTSSSGGVGITQFKLSSERKPLTSCIIFR